MAQTGESTEERRRWECISRGRPRSGALEGSPRTLTCSCSGLLEVLAQEGGASGGLAREPLLRRLQDPTQGVTAFRAP